MNNNYCEIVKNHYNEIWKTKVEEKIWEKGPVDDLGENFRVLLFPPNNARNLYTYATCGMSEHDILHPIELHVFSQKEDDTLIELLTIIAHFHKTGNSLGLNHTVNFGRSWQDKSDCDHGLISLPYLDGPNLETKALANHQIKFFWLIPITKMEVEYKKKFGVDSLEILFESNQFNFADPKRKSVV